MPFSADDSRVKAYPKEAREIWARVANDHLKRHPDEDANAIRIAWTAVRNAGYGKGDGDEKHKWTYSGHRTPEELSKINTWAPFTYPMTMTKAGGKDADPWIEGIISGNQVDRQDEVMEISALKSIVKQLNTGNVLLLQSHADTLECGKSMWGKLLKNGEEWDGDEDTLKEGDTVEVLARFSLNKASSHYAQLMEEYGNKQFSVGGAVVSAFKEISKKTGQIVRKLKDVVLEHVALTREKQAAYAPSQVTAAMSKAVNWDDVPENERGGETMELKEALSAVKSALETLTKVAKGNGTLDLTKDVESDGHGGFRIKKDAMTRNASKMSKEERREAAALAEQLLNAAGIMTVTEAPKVLVFQKVAGVPTVAPAAPGTAKGAVETLVKETIAGLEKQIAELKGMVAKGGDATVVKEMQSNLASLTKAQGELQAKLTALEKQPAAARPAPVGTPVEKTFSESNVPTATDASAVMQKAAAKQAELKAAMDAGAAMLKSGQIKYNSPEHLELQRKSDQYNDMRAGLEYGYRKHFSAELQKA